MRFKRDQWPQFKEKSPLGQCPYLEVIEGNGSFFLGQTNAIARYLAKKFHMAGSDERDQAEVDMYVDQINDLFNEMMKCLYEKDEAKKLELIKQFENEIVPTNLKLFETRIEKNGTGYLGFSGLSYADIFLYHLLELMEDRREQALNAFPLVKKMHQSIHLNPRIAAWQGNRPRTAH